FFLSTYSCYRDLHSFPTRRSSDLLLWGEKGRSVRMFEKLQVELENAARFGRFELLVEFLYELQNFLFRRFHTVRVEAESEGVQGDRKSTRLNSSHVKISYAVFCLK